MMFVPPNAGVGQVLAQCSVQPVGVRTFTEALDLALYLLRALCYVQVRLLHAGMVSMRVQVPLPAVVLLRLQLRCLSEALLRDALVVVVLLRLQVRMCPIALRDPLPVVV